MELLDDTEVDTIWFMPLTDSSDYMASLTRQPGERWTLEYRFRYYSPQSKNPHDGKDHKNVYKIRNPEDGPDTPERLRRAGDEAVMRMLGDGALGPAFRLEVRGGSEQAMEMLAQHSWFHAAPNAPGGDA